MSKKVLTIDDSKTVRLIVTKHLSPFGVETLEAENGEIGIAIAKEGKPDLILLDYNMPVKDGHQTLLALMDDPSTSPIPVIMLTTETVQDTVLKLIKLGLKDFIPKPFTREVLLKKINTVLALFEGDEPPSLENVQTVVTRTPIPSRSEVKTLSAPSESSFVKNDKKNGRITMNRKNYDDLMKQSLQKMNDGGIDAAFSFLESFIRKNPDAIEGYIVRSEMYYEMGQAQRAFEDIAKALKIDPNEPILYYNRGLSYAKSGDMSKALEDFNKAITLDPAYADAYSNRANCYLKMREFEKVISDCTKAIEHQKDERAIPYYNRGLAYANKGELVKASADYKKAIELASDNPGLAQAARNDLRKCEALMSGSKSGETKSGGCYVATCVYGSYDCPEVWTLRRFRDNTLMSNQFGRVFIRFYYAISPRLVSIFGNSKWFNKICKPLTDTLVSFLKSKGVGSSAYCDR